MRISLNKNYLKAVPDELCKIQYFIKNNRVEISIKLKHIRESGFYGWVSRLDMLLLWQNKLYIV